MLFFSLYYTAVFFDGSKKWLSWFHCDNLTWRSCTKYPANLTLLPLLFLNSASLLFFLQAKFVSSSKKGDPDRTPSPASHLALLVMCCQPQQKSGRKQPETNTSLPLQGMLCFLKEGQGRQASRAEPDRQTKKKNLKCVKDNPKENKTP